jgi:hypothetical protein
MLLKVCLKWNVRRLTACDLDVAGSKLPPLKFSLKRVNLNFKSRLKSSRLFSGRLSRTNLVFVAYRGVDKSLARPVRKQATATEDFDFHMSYLSS